MRYTVLASGSKGNSTYLETNNHKILIDLGTTSLYVTKNLKKLNIDPKDIDIIILTHTHIDHINGLSVFLKKYNPTIFLSEKMYKELNNILPIQEYYLLEDDVINIDSLKIFIFKLSHDSSDSNGYVFTENNKSIVYITDTGYINRKYDELLKNKEHYIIEFNHDINKLMKGRYPYYLKQRILSDMGHLSNYDATRYLKKYVGNNTKCITLIHLSHENNSPDLALEEINKVINNIDVQISEQNVPTKMVEV